jgi:hypothetical protein
MALPKTQNLTTDERIIRIYKFKMVLLNFFDPCKSVLSVVKA